MSVQSTTNIDVRSLCTAAVRLAPAQVLTLGTIYVPSGYSIVPSYATISVTQMEFVSDTGTKVDSRDNAATVALTRGYGVAERIAEVTAELGQTVSTQLSTPPSPLSGIYTVALTNNLATACVCAHATFNVVIEHV